jgi:predicted LPLAT superfamily acyltransferase
MTQLPGPNTSAESLSNGNAAVTSSANVDDKAKPNKAEWTQAPERSTDGMLKLMAWIATTLGRRIARACLVPIATYYMLFSPRESKNSRRFLARALNRDITWGDGYRHIHTFAATILDRVYFLREGVTPFDIQVHGHEVLQAAAKEDPGAFLVGGHLGSFEVMRAVGDRIGGLNVAMVMYPGNAQKVNQVLHALAPDRPVPIIELGRMESMLAVRDWLNTGGLAGMLGDRSLQENTNASRTLTIPFLGTDTQFIDGPMRLAALLKRRVYFMAGLYRGGNRYEVHFKPLVDFREVAGPAREAAIVAAVQAYVQQLEALAREAPYNWFNFHDFWHEDAPA